MRLVGLKKIFVLTSFYCICLRIRLMMKTYLICIFLFLGFHSSAIAHVDQWDAHKSEWPTSLRLAYDVQSIEALAKYLKEKSLEDILNINYNNKINILETAIRANNTKALVLLLDKGISPDWEMYKSRYPLMVAVEARNTIAVDILLKKGADVNLSNSSGRTALMQACVMGYNKIVERLLQEDALMLNLKSKIEGNTALHFAMYSCDIEIIKSLYDSGATSCLNHQGFSPLSLLVFDTSNTKDKPVESRDVINLLSK